MKRIIISENQARQIFAGNYPQKMRNTAPKTVQERYLYHTGDIDNVDNPTPHYSEARWQKFEGSGHETGSFGSGMYFTSAYPHDGRWYRDDYKTAINKRERGEGPKKNLIQIGDALYCVDTDFYKNLYVIKSEYEAKLLEGLMEAVNSFVRTYNYDSNRNTKWRQYRWLEINHIAKTLGIKVPWDYRGMCEFAQNYCKDTSIRPTPATIFMEKNGYNGVDATFGGKYDSYWQGSVIYDLSKVEQHIEPVTGPRDEMSIRFGEYGKNMADSLFNQGRYSKLSNYNSDYDYRKLDNPQTVLMILKRYKHILPESNFYSLPDEVKSKYLDILYNNIQSGYIDIDADRAFMNGVPSIKELTTDTYVKNIIKFKKIKFINLNPRVTGAIIHKIAWGYGIDNDTAVAFVRAYKGDIATEYPDEWEFIQGDYDFS